MTGPNHIWPLEFDALILAWYVVEGDRSSRSVLEEPTWAVP